MSREQDGHKAVAAALGTRCYLELVSSADVEAIHDAMISEYGGTPGVKDKRLLRSIVAKQLRAIVRGDPSLPSVAASLARGLARGGPFLDGNKRTAFGCLIAILDANGAAYDFDPVEAHQVFTWLADGRVTEKELAAWIRGITADEQGPSRG